MATTYDRRMEELAPGWPSFVKMLMSPPGQPPWVHFDNDKWIMKVARQHDLDQSLTRPRSKDPDQVNIHTLEFKDGMVMVFVCYYNFQRDIDNGLTLDIMTQRTWDESGKKIIMGQLMKHTIYTITD